MQANDNPRLDHRALGAKLDLFHFQEEAPGMVFWHPRGLALFRRLEELVRRLLARDDYEEVRTPQLVRQPIWEASGHWQHFRSDMFVLDGEPASALKPVSCPCHIEIARRRVQSYRALPLRLSEVGLVHRNEQSGALSGLFRLRQFTQDDGHIFCREEDVVEEVGRYCRSAQALYSALGFGAVEARLALRPEARAGQDSDWDRAEALLGQAVRAAGWDAPPLPGGGAFYGPKIELSLRDGEGKVWQCGTIQLDLAMPERFGFYYVDADGARRVPAMLHRALFGSYERFIAILLEHSQGRLPAWLCPEQVAIIPVGPAHAEVAGRLRRALAERGVAARLFPGERGIGARVLEAKRLAIPVVAVLGDRELADGSVALDSGEGAKPWPWAEAVERLALEGALVAMPLI